MNLPTKLTPELAVALVQARRSGLSIKKCSTVCNVSFSTLKSWRLGTPEPGSLTAAWRQAFDDAYSMHVKDTVAALVAQLDNRSTYKLPPLPVTQVIVEPEDLEAMADEILAEVPAYG